MEQKLLAAKSITSTSSAGNYAYKLTTSMKGIAKVTTTKMKHHNE